MHIKPLNQEHVPDIARLDALCFAAGAFPESVVAPMFAQTGFIALGAYIKGELMCCLLGISVLDEAELWSIATHPHVQGQGYASEIFKAFEAALHEKNVCDVFWEVRKSNAPAIRFYEKLGAELYGERKGFYPPENGQGAEDALLYRYALHKSTQ